LKCYKLIKCIRSGADAESCLETLPLRFIGFIKGLVTCSGILCVLLVAIVSVLLLLLLVLPGLLIVGLLLASLGNSLSTGGSCSRAHGLVFELVPHDLDTAVFCENLIFEASDFAVLLELLFLKLFFKSVLVLVSIVGEALGVPARDGNLLAVIGLLEQLRHNLVAKHLRVHDAVEGAVLRRLKV